MGNGKVALVTGASRGIGRGIVYELAAAGYDVWFTARTVTEGGSPLKLPGSIAAVLDETKGLPGRVTAVACDHRDDGQTRGLFERLEREAGHLDLLVNNVWGGYEFYADGTEFWTEDEFWKVPLKRWDDNFLAGPRAHYLCSALASRLLAASGGTIVTVSYWAAVRPDKGVAYGMAKAACDQLTRTLAHELRRHGVACFGLYPGLVRTEAVLMAPEGHFDFSNSESPRFQGLAVAALDGDPDKLSKTGSIQVSAQVALDYGFADIDGKRPVPLTVDRA